jgi:hypothetical protein
MTELRTAVWYERRELGHGSHLNFLLTTPGVFSDIIVFVVGF